MVSIGQVSVSDSEADTPSLMSTHTNLPSTIQPSTKRLILLLTILYSILGFEVLRFTNDFNENIMDTPMMKINLWMVNTEIKKLRNAQKNMQITDNKLMHTVLKGFSEI